MNNINEKIEALAVYFEVEADAIEHTSGEYYKVEGAEYKVFNEEEREEAVTEYIKETVWAFRASFLADMTDIDEVVFETFHKADLCESSNEAILAIINATCGLDIFVDRAVQADGYGHFLSSYDGEELELDNDFYAYKE